MPASAYHHRETEEKTANAAEETPASEPNQQPKVYLRPFIFKDPKQRNGNLFTKVRRPEAPVETSSASDSSSFGKPGYYSGNKRLPSLDAFKPTTGPRNSKASTPAAAPPVNQTKPAPVQHHIRPKPTPKPTIASEYEKFTQAWKTISESKDQLIQPRFIMQTLPWPIMRFAPNSLSTIPVSVSPTSFTTKTISAFLLSSEHSTEVSMKRRLHAALRMYHPDRFDVNVMTLVVKEEREQVRECVLAVTRALNELLEKA
jgi:hypothetical protein